MWPSEAIAPETLNLVLAGIITLVNKSSAVANSIGAVGVPILWTVASLTIILAVNKLWPVLKLCASRARLPDASFHLSSALVSLETAKAYLAYLSIVKMFLVNAA